MQAVARERCHFRRRQIRDTGRARQRDVGQPVRYDASVAVPVSPAEELAGAERNQANRRVREYSQRDRRRRRIRSYGGALHRPHLPFVVRF